MGIMDNISESLQKGDPLKVAEFTQQAIENNIDPKTILDNGLISVEQETAHF